MVCVVSESFVTAKSENDTVMVLVVPSNENWRKSSKNLISQVLFQKKKRAHSWIYIPGHGISLGPDIEHKTKESKSWPGEKGYGNFSSHPRIQ